MRIHISCIFTIFIEDISLFMFFKGGGGSFKGVFQRSSLLKYFSRKKASGKINKGTYFSRLHNLIVNFIFSFKIQFFPSLFPVGEGMGYELLCSSI